MHRTELVGAKRGGKASAATSLRPTRRNAILKSPSFKTLLDATISGVMSR
jgi:hypothetical protein